MTDLGTRFRSIREAPSPELWHEIEHREPRPNEDVVAPLRKFGIVALAFLVASFGIGFVIHAFRGGPRRAPTTTRSVGPLTVRSNGDIYYVLGGGGDTPQIASVNPNGTGRQVALASTQGVHYQRIAFSSDGSRIAFADDANGSSGIAVANADGSGVNRLTDGVNDSWPSWSPDGTKIAFSGTGFDPGIRRCAVGVDIDCPTDIYVMDADGSDLTRLTTDTAPEYHPVWSPDGTRIAFVTYRADGGAVISVMNADGTGERPISSGTNGSDSSPSWSPDGSLIVFESIRNENWGIYVVAPDGTGERVIKQANTVDSPVWSPDGSLIAFIAIDPGSGDASLFTMRPDGSDATLVATERPPGIGGYLAWRPIPASSSSTSVAPESPRPPALPTLDPGAVVTVPVSTFPEGVAVGERGVWVVAGNGDGSGKADIARLDPRTGDVVARITNVPVPGWEFGGGGIAAGAGSVWVVGNAGGDVVLTQIDPATNAVADTIRVGPGSKADVWADASGIWVLSFKAGDRSMEVARIDAATHAIMARIPVPATWSQVIFASGGSIWVQGTSPGAHGSVEVNTLYRIDPSTNTLVDTIDIGQQSGFALAVDPNGAWAAVPGGIERFDTTTGSFVGSVIEIEPSELVPDGLGGAWIEVAHDQSHARTWLHIDASGVINEQIDVPRSLGDALTGIAHMFDPTTGALWIVDYKDSVSRIDLAG
jgi:TolB protein